MKGSAVLLTPPPPPLKPIKKIPSHLRLPNNFTKHYEKKKEFTEKQSCSVLSNCLSVLILYFNAAKFSIKLFYFIYFAVYFVSQWDKYEIVTEMQPFKNS